MALSDLYNYVSGVRNTITDEVYTNVGSDSFQLGTVKRAFTEDNFQIEDADSGGNILIKDVDYELLEKDTYYTTQEGEDIYTKVKILNSFYQTGSLYITYDCIGSYIDKATIQTLLTDVATNANDISDLQSNPALPESYIAGLEISNGTDTDHDIDIATGRCKDSTGAYDLILSSGLTKQIDAAWSAGDDAGGLDTGSRK